MMHSGLPLLPLRFRFHRNEFQAEQLNGHPLDMDIDLVILLKFKDENIKNDIPRGACEAIDDML